MARRNSQVARVDGGNGKNTARSIVVAKRGIRTAGDFADYMSGLMADVVEGTISPQVANAGASAGGKLLRIVEMQFKYGSPAKSGRRALVIAGDLSESRR